MTTIQTTGQPVRIVGLGADDYGCSDNRPPLLLLHGITFDRATWRDIVPELQRIDLGRRVVAIGLPGHGQSPDQATQELEDAAGQLHLTQTDGARSLACRTFVLSGRSPLL